MLTHLSSSWRGPANRHVAGLKDFRCYHRRLPVTPLAALHEVPRNELADPDNMLDLEFRDLVRGMERICYITDEVGALVVFAVSEDMRLWRAAAHVWRDMSLAAQGRYVETVRTTLRLVRTWSTEIAALSGYNSGVVERAIACWVSGRPLEQVCQVALELYGEMFRHTAQRVDVSIGQLQRGVRDACLTLFEDAFVA